LRREIGKVVDGLGAGGENGGARKSQLTGKKKRLFRSVGGWIHLLLIVIIIEIEYQRLTGRLTADIQIAAPPRLLPTSKRYHKSHLRFICLSAISDFISRQPTTQVYACTVNLIYLHSATRPFTCVNSVHDMLLSTIQLICCLKRSGMGRIE